MAIGRIKWFGGLNNQAQKINNYGFIIPIAYENTDKIFVHRNDIKGHVHDLEGKNGEGIYVQFEIETGSKGQYAVNVDVLFFVGIVDWFDEGRGYIKCEGRPDVRFTSSEFFDSGDILRFGLRYNSKRNKDEAILVQRIINLAEDKEIILKCIQSSDPDIFLACFIKYIHELTLEEVVVLVGNQIKLLNTWQKEKLINELFDKTENIFLMSSRLRSFLPINNSCSNSYEHFIDKHINTVAQPLRQELLAELIERLRIASDSERTLYWNRVKYLQQNLEYKGFLWDVAPIEQKKQLIQDKYKKFFDAVSQFNDSNYHYEQAITGDWHNLYDFDEFDKTLIRQWDSNVDRHPFTEAKMISARGAEKLVKQFYKTLGYVVEDISIHQITQESHDWIKGDIRIDSTKLLDVKNARSPVNSHVYSEFCVPSFKQYRGNDVNVVGVLSPYLNKAEIYGIKQPSPKRSNPDVSVLGAFDKTKLQQLEFIFCERLIKVDMSRGFDSRSYLPQWLFDYDDRFYVKQLEAVKRFQQLQDADIPSWKDVSTVGQNSLPLFIAAKRALPRTWLNNLPKWQAAFINSLVNLPTERISLPYLFLSVLKHFLTMLSCEDSGYSPQQYRELLYPKSLAYCPEHPLKLYDPLNTIKEFCDTLQDIWNERGNVQLTEFKIFKFNGRGLLQGKRSEAESLATTILAYCGGWVEGQGKCGFPRLVIGKHKSCPTCGRLICPKCHHCSDNCLSYFERKKT